MTFDELISYFEDISIDHKDLKDFVHGPVEMLISLSRSNLLYPCLMLEHPPATISKNGESLQLNRPISFVVLINVENNGTGADEFSSKVQAYKTTEAICLDVIARIAHQIRTGAVKWRMDIDQASLDPVNTLFVDNDCGWRVEFRVKDPLSLCDRPLKWHSTTPPPPAP